MNDKKINCVLHIDTSDNKKTLLTLTIGKEKIRRETETAEKTSQILLPQINIILKENNLEMKDISEIFVNPGPGSYTGCRVGITVANALGWLLDIPVNGKKNNIVDPVY